MVIVHTLAEAAAQWIDKAGLRVVETGRGSMHRVFVVERAPSGASAVASSEAPAGAPAEAPAGASAGAGPDAAAAARAEASAEVPAGARAEASGERLPSGGGPYLDLGGLDLSAYVRRQGRFVLGEVSYQARGFWGLPEFDTVSYGSDAAASLGERVLAGSRPREVLIVNPGLGHLALWAARRLRPAAITGASRDLLSLAATASNLAAAGGVAYRAADALRLDELPEASLDLILETPDLVPSFDWAALCWARAGRLVKAGGTYLAVCPPTEAGRLEKRRLPGWRLLGERRKRGALATAWRRD